MEKSWNQLSDRCQLFWTAPSGLYKELLKEAECELANKCSLFTRMYTLIENLYDPDPSGELGRRNSFKLPEDFKSIKNVWRKGNLLKQSDRSTWTMVDVEDGNSYQWASPTGTPTEYYISNNYITFNYWIDTNVNSFEMGNVIIEYIAHLQNTEHINKVVTGKQQGATSISLDTTLNEQLNGLDVQSHTYLDGVSFQNIVFVSPSTSSSIEPFSPNFEGSMTPNANQFSGGANYSCDDSGGGTPIMKFTDMVIHSYRTVAPVIPSAYHSSLCDYALYIAMAKDDRELSMKHQQLWEKTIIETLNDNLDSDLIFSVKEVI